MEDNRTMGQSGDEGSRKGAEAQKMSPYPEMNGEIVGLLRHANLNFTIYAADRIEELERENARLKAALDNIANGRNVDGDVTYYWGYMEEPYRSAALNALDGGRGVPSEQRKRRGAKLCASASLREDSEGDKR